MDQTFATTDVHPRDRLEYWREVACRTYVDLECRTRVGAAFRASLRSGLFADLGISVVDSDACEVHRTPQGILRARSDALLLSVQMAGSAILIQDGREARLGPGDFALYDTQRSYALDVHAGTRQLVLKIPRKALEARLGCTALHTARGISAVKPMGGLASGFLMSLPSRTGALDPDCERRVAEQALDLVALSCAQEARDAKALYSSAGTYTLLNLKTAIDARLSDPTLSPARAAAAGSISVRHANALLAREGTSLERYILGRRLERCRAALDDPMQAHRTIAEIAYAWGFASASHFTHRFKQRFGATPKEYRHRHH
jgi:AraC-like DNA-binding protein